MSTAPARPSADAMFESLTGHDEVAIVDRFGDEIHHLRVRPFTFLRALIYVHQLRANKAADVVDPEGKAYTAALDVPLGEINDYFGPEPVEVDPDEPETPAGKGATPSVNAPGA